MTEAEAAKRGYWETKLMDTSVIIKLSQETKFNIEVLFNLLDIDHNGVITREDFVKHEGGVFGAGGAALGQKLGATEAEVDAKWKSFLGLVDDLNGDQQINAEEFIYALQLHAMKSTPSEASPDEGSHFEHVKWLSASINESINTLCTSMYATIKASRAHQDATAHQQVLQQAASAAPSKDGGSPSVLDIEGTSREYVDSLHRYLSSFRS